MWCMAPLYVTNSKKKSSAQHKSSPFRSRVVPSNEPQLINNTNSGNKRLLLSESANNSSLASYRELAMKYYAAFPALGSSGDDDCLITTSDGRSLIAAITTPTKKPFTNNSNNTRKRFDNNKWNGQRIIQMMSTADSCGSDGFDSCDERQTLSESTYWPKITDKAVAKPSLQQEILNENAIKSFNSKTFDTLIAKISEELICNNNKLSLTSISEDLLSSNAKNNNDDNNDSNNNNSFSSNEIFGVNGTKLVYCGDIEDDMIKQCTDSDNNGVNSCSLVVNNYNNRNNSRNSNNNISSNCETNLSEDVYDYGSQEGEVLQKLVEKFNSNIASIWSSNDANEDSVSAKSLSKSRDNIWSFDSSFSSSQSSATPSPKYFALNGIDVWSSAELMDDKAINSMTPINMVPNLPTIPEIWESSVLLKSMKTLFESDENAVDEENWISSDLFVPQNTTFEYNTTTLKNHHENSLFVEYSSSFGSSLSKREKNFLKQFDRKLSINEQITTDYEPDENLLTSPKTHFTPIKSYSFDSDDGFYGDLDSELSSKLVICSDKCPNNASFIEKQNLLSSVVKPRAVSTSLQELSSFMGPFGSDSELLAEDLDNSTSDSSSDDALDVISNEKRDISTNTDNEAEMLSTTTLTPIIEIDTSAECEPDYQDLCKMVNDVLQNGLADVYCLPNEDCGYDASIICNDDYDDNLATIVDYGNNDDFNDYDYNEWQSYNDSSVDESSNLVVLSTFKFEMKSKNTEVHNRNRKACTFFLEGNCKRSDCKYSHDISGITCKYWKEGFCFKFDSCPFLHQ